MNRIQKNVTLSAVRGEENYDAYNLSPDACAILISYSGENPNLLALNTILRARNIPTIAITSIGENRLSQECTCFYRLQPVKNSTRKLATLPLIPPSSSY